MPTTFVKGDFLADFPTRAAGPRAVGCPVDASGKLNAGVAVAVAKRFPAFAEWWAERCATTPAQHGDAAAWAEGNDVVYALVMQGGTRAKLAWLDRAVRTMLSDAAKRGIERINAPRLWGGPNGVDGLRAKRILDDAALSAPIALTVYEQFIRKVEDAEPEDEEIDEEEDVEPEPAPQKSATQKKADGKKKAVAKKAAARPATTKKKTAPKKKAASKRN